MTVRRVTAVVSRHPVNRTLIDEAPLGVRIADRVTGFMGSWTFIVIQTVVVIVWVTGNVYLLFHFDPFPFILLNLAFSTQAAYAAPLILLAGNRAAQRDRMTLEHTATEADKEEMQNRDILQGIARLEEANNVLLQRVIALEQTIVANQRLALAGTGERESRPASGREPAADGGPSSDGEGRGERGAS